MAVVEFRVARVRNDGKRVYHCIGLDNKCTKERRGGCGNYCQAHFEDPNKVDVKQALEGMGVGEVRLFDGIRHKKTETQTKMLCGEEGNTCPDYVYRDMKCKKHLGLVTPRKSKEEKEGANDAAKEPKPPKIKPEKGAIRMKGDVRQVYIGQWRPACLGAEENGDLCKREKRDGTDYCKIHKPK